MYDFALNKRAHTVKLTPRSRLDVERVSCRVAVKKKKKKNMTGSLIRYSPFAGRLGFRIFEKRSSPAGNDILGKKYAPVEFVYK